MTQPPEPADRDEDRPPLPKPEEWPAPQPFPEPAGYDDAFDAESEKRSAASTSGSIAAAESSASAPGTNSPDEATAAPSSAGPDKPAPQETSVQPDALGIPQKKPANLEPGATPGMSNVPVPPPAGGNQSPPNYPGYPGYGASYPPPPPGYHVGQQAPYGGWAAPLPSAPLPRQDGKAIMAMVLGIVGLCGVGPLLCCLFALLGGIAQMGCGVGAIVLGIKSRQDIRNSDGQLTGEGLALAGIIIGAVTAGAGFLTTIIGFADFLD